jgi:hypothetical protein
MKRPTAVCVIALIAMSLIFSKTTFACGTIKDFIEGYNDKRHIFEKWIFLNKKEALLGIINCAAGYYEGPISDRHLLPVILDALENFDSIDNMNINDHGMHHKDLLDPDNLYSGRGTLKFLLEEIYRKFNCLKGASGMEGYSFVSKEFGTSSCPGESIIKLKVKAKNSAYIRMSPGGKIIGYAKDGTVVHLVSKDGEWVKIVKPGYPVTTVLGYIHSSLLEEID